MAANANGGFRKLRQIAVLGFLFLFFFVPIVFNGLQFDWIDGHNFVLGAALRARDQFALVYIVFFKIKISIAFRTVNQDLPPLFEIAAPVNI